MAAGVNQAVLHGFAYADAPGVTWPGFAAFSPYYNGAVGYGEAWGPRTPQWRHMPDVAGYLARTQLVLQTGRADLRRRVPAPEGVGLHRDRRRCGPRGTGSRSAGRTPSSPPRCSTCPGSRCEDGRARAGRPGVQGDGRRPGPVPRPGAHHRGRGRPRLRDFAAAGLPVVLLGDWTQAQPVGLAQAGETEEVRSLMVEVIAASTTRVVTDQSDIPARARRPRRGPGRGARVLDLMHVRVGSEGDEGGRPVLPGQRQARREPAAGPARPGRLAHRREPRRGAGAARRVDRGDDAGRGVAARGRPGAGAGST